MNSFVKCFDAVSMVTEEATEQFSPIWVLNPEKYRILAQYCSVIDALAKEAEGIAYDVEIDDIKMTVIIDLECAASEITLRSQSYYTHLVQHSVSFGFSKSEDGNLVIHFEFPPVWDLADFGRSRE